MSVTALAQVKTYPLGRGRYLYVATGNTVGDATAGDVSIQIPLKASDTVPLARYYAVRSFRTWNTGASVGQYLKLFANQWIDSVAAVDEIYIDYKSGVNLSVIYTRLLFLGEPTLYGSGQIAVGWGTNTNAVSYYLANIQILASPLATELL